MNCVYHCASLCGTVPMVLTLHGGLLHSPVFLEAAGSNGAIDSEYWLNNCMSLALTVGRLGVQHYRHSANASQTVRQLPQ
jgi:hypothetical protein